MFLFRFSTNGLEGRHEPGAGQVVDAGVVGVAVMPVKSFHEEGDKPMTPDQYIASLPADRRAAVVAVDAAIRKAVPKLTSEVMAGMGSPVIGYGKYHYKSASGREGDWFLVGLCAGKGNYSLHICAADKGGYLVEQNAAKLGKVKTGRSCINFKKLEDLKLDAAMALVKQAVKTGGLNAA
jgi:hypothetical protein